jgi:hypothetical protein
VSKSNDVSYTIRRIGGQNERRRAHREHLSTFKTSKTTPPDLVLQREPPVPLEARTGVKRDGVSQEDDSDDDADYEVQQVVGHYVSETGIWFLLQWKGYDELTWSQEDDLDCGALVTKYFQGFTRRQQG